MSAKIICGLRSLLRQANGQNTVEYALLIALISFGVLTSLRGCSAQITRSLQATLVEMMDSLL